MLAEHLALDELANKRITRVVVPDFPHRVVQRGARRMDVFFSADDRQEYLGLLSQSASKHRVGFFCLVSDE
jgi:putative transposase